MIDFRVLRSRVYVVKMFLAVTLGGQTVLQAAPRLNSAFSREMTPKVSRCLLQREPALISAWLRTLPGTDDETILVAHAEPRFAACFDPWGQTAGGWKEVYDTAGMRAALVRAVLQSRRGLLPHEPAQSNDAQPWFDTPSIPNDPGVTRAILVADFGTCLARKRWTDVVALVSAVDPVAEQADFLVVPRLEAARKREAAKVVAVLSNLIPDIAGCVPAGMKLRLENQGLRNILEEAAYRLTDR